MIMGKLIRRLSVILLVIGMGMLFSALFDPYGVFHPKNCRNYRTLSVNQRCLKIRHILDSPDEYDTLLFGSSRVGTIDVNELDQEQYGLGYNMTYSGGTPADHFEDIRFLIENNAAPKRILLGFDDGGILAINQDTHANLLRRPYPYDGNFIEFYADYLNPTVGLKALSKGGLSNILTMFSGETSEYLYTDGQSKVEAYKAVENWLTVSEDEHITRMSELPRYSSVLSRELRNKARSILLETVALCADNNIELTLFTTPNHVSYFCSYPEDLVAFLYDLAQEADFLNFIGVNAVTTNPFNYYEREHFCTTAGAYVVSVLNGEALDQSLCDQYFGLVVSKENANDFATVMLKDATAYIHHHS